MISNMMSLGGNGGLVVARSTKLKLVSRSSTESELIALDDSICFVLWCRRLLKELGYHQGPTTVFQDNKSAIIISEKGFNNGNESRHMRNRYHYIRQCIEEGSIKIEYLPTAEMVADFFTKPLAGARFRDLRGAVMGKV